MTVGCHPGEVVLVDLTGIIGADRDLEWHRIVWAEHRGEDVAVRTSLAEGWYWA